VTARRRAEQAPAVPRLTMRVTRIRDGRVIEQHNTVITTADPLTPLLTSVWPPCECPQHRKESRE
jgi:hypothetical protein